MIGYGSRTLATTLLFGGLLFVRLTAPDVVDAERQRAERAPCCFTREGYRGLCVVQPAEGETCLDILNYLNTPNSTGKTYCQSTTLRGGWALVDCRNGE